MALAFTTATRADCVRRQVGAVLIMPDRTLAASGYNGAPSGDTGCMSGGCPRATSTDPPYSSYDTGPTSCVAIHAELNCLLRASWAEQKHATIYCTDRPCDACLRIIRASGVDRVVWARPESGEWNRN